MGGLKLEFACQTSETIKVNLYCILPSKTEQHSNDSGYESSCSLEDMTTAAGCTLPPAALCPGEERSRTRAARRAAPAQPAARRRASAPPPRSAAIAASLQMKADAALHTPPSRRLGLSRRGRSERRAGQDPVTRQGQDDPAGPVRKLLLDPPGPGPPPHRPMLHLRQPEVAPRADLAHIQVGPLCPRPTLGHVIHGGKVPGLPGRAQGSLPVTDSFLPAWQHPVRLGCTSWTAASSTAPPLHLCCHLNCPKQKCCTRNTTHLSMKVD